MKTFPFFFVIISFALSTGQASESHYYPFSSTEPQRAISRENQFLPIFFDITDTLQHLIGTLHLLVRAMIRNDFPAKKLWLYYSVGAGWDSTEMGPVANGKTWFGDIPAGYEIHHADPIARNLSLYFRLEGEYGNTIVHPADSDSVVPPRYPFAVESSDPSRKMPSPKSALRFIKIFDSDFDGDSLIFDAPSGDRVALSKNNIPSFPATPETITITYPSITGAAGNLAELSAERREIVFSSRRKDIPINLRIHFLKERIGQWEPERVSLVEFGGGVPVPRPYGGIFNERASCIDGNVIIGGGLWAVGRDTREQEDRGILRNIRLSPNPFSPNGDGIYDAVAISFETILDGKIDIDIYDLNGEHIRNLARDVLVPTGKSDNFLWNGFDKNSEIGKAGIYAVRFVFAYFDDGKLRKISKNVPVVLLK